jgi:hypothetical protein
MNVTTHLHERHVGGVVHGGGEHHERDDAPA